MLLNDGLHSISVFINDDPESSVLYVIDVLSFMVVESGTMRKEFKGSWVAIIRPKLEWQTEQLS
jgi:hypothetical protein